MKGGVVYGTLDLDRIIVPSSNQYSESKVNIVTLLIE